MQWKFLITNLFAGKVQGTNDQAIAAVYAMNDDFFVADVEAGTWLVPKDNSEIEAVSIEEIEDPSPQEGEDSTDSEDD